MKISAARLLLAAFCLSGLALPSLQAQVGVLQGQVVDAAGNPIPDVQIRIEGIDIRRNYKVKTNKDGKYYHGGVHLQARYRVIAEKEGYQTDYVQGVQPGFDRSDERGVIDFTLREGRSGPLAFELTDEQRAELERQRQEQEKQAETSAAVREHMNQGIDFFNQKQYEQAAGSFKAALELDEQQPTLWGNLGLSYARMQQNDKALEAYHKAIELAPEDPTFHQNLGGVYSAMGDTEKAKNSYEKAAELSALLDPGQAAVNYYNMGVAFINAGKTSDAIEALRKCVQADPNYAEAYYQLGLSLLGVNQIEESVAQLKKYVELSPNGPNAEVAKQLIGELGK